MNYMNQIMSLTGLSATTASFVLNMLDVATALSVLLFLTGIGSAAGAAVWSFRMTIGAIAKTSRNAAIQL
ncbi:hypothetical protein ABES25_23700 [Bacillus gobiensis]|uniref:hypothetical protein n=1 Tax=Bacillus gobiensis TaxID=1441095 RepID=UPI003D1E5E88